MSSREEIEKSIAEAGDHVRSLKSGGTASKEEIQSAVDVLLSRKAELLSLDESAGGAAAEGGEEGKGKEAAAGGAPTQTVTPFAVEAGEEGIDYGMLIRDFGTTPIDEALLNRLTALAETRGMTLHPFLRRGLFFSHRDLTATLNAHEKGEPVYLYTGRGPSSASMHLGHAVPFMFTKYLQDLFDCPLVVQITDDEKQFWKDIKPDEMEVMMRANIRDIIAFGFNPDKTFIFANTRYMGYMWPIVVQLAKRMTANVAMHTLGLTLSDNVGKYIFTAIQAAPSFAMAFPLIFGTDKKELQRVHCLVPCAIDQDPFFRICRDIAPRLKKAKIPANKPSIIHAKFLPALGGATTKMSASSADGAVYFSDTPKQIKKKIGGAFSGGQALLEDHRRLGGNPDIDVSFQYLRIFLDDDERLEELRQGFIKGEVTSGDMKAALIEFLQKMVADHKAAREAVTDEMIDLFMTPRALSLGTGKGKAAE